MRLQRLARGDDYLERALSFLMAREAEHNLMLGILAGVASGREWVDSSPYLALVLDGETPVAAAVMTPPHNLVISHTDRAEALTLLSQDLLGSGYQVPGVTGEPSLAVRFAEMWRQAAGGTYRQAFAQRIYQLDQVRPPVGVPGRLRQAAEEDRPFLREWFAGFYHDAGLDDGDPDKSVERFLRLESRGLYLWEDGEPVSMAGHIAVTPHGDRVGAVYTTPEKRRRGYAGACVAAVSRKLLDEGRRFCFLYTDLANPTSNHIYQEIGYRPVADSVMLRFED